VTDEVPELPERKVEAAHRIGAALTSSGVAPVGSYVQLRFVEVAVALPSTNPVVVLEEIDAPHRILRIPIGLPEGVAIAYGAQAIPTPKPLTHELMTSILEAFGLALEVVRITDVRGTAFYGELVIGGSSGGRTFPCRPSDGLALALRQRLFVPVVAASRVLEVAGETPKVPGNGEAETASRPTSGC
jgi:bifunctional DNase/RNase